MDYFIPVMGLVFVLTFAFVMPPFDPEPTLQKTDYGWCVSVVDPTIVSISVIRCTFKGDVCYITGDGISCSFKDK